MKIRIGPLMNEAGSTETPGAPSGETTQTTETPAAPSAPASGDNAPQENPAGVDWDALSEGGDLDDSSDGVQTPEPKVEQPAATIPVQSPTTPAAQPAAQPAATPAAPAQAAAPAQPTQPATEVAQPAAPTQPAVPQKSQAEIEAALKAQLDAAFTNLVDFYKLPEDMAVKAQTEPEAVLPWMAARIHQQVAMSMQQALQSVLPQMIQQVNVASTVEEKAKEAFFGKWPALRPYESQVKEVTAFFRRVNPAITGAAAIEAIGKLAHQTLNIPVPGMAATPSATPAAQPAQSAFRPAGTGGAVRGAPEAGSNVFSEMAEAMLLGEDD